MGTKKRRNTDRLRKRMRRPVRLADARPWLLFRNLCLAREDLAEFEHRPKSAERPYRIVVLRKTIVEERGQLCLGQSYRYFFYVT